MTARIITNQPIDTLTPNPRNPRTHSKKQIKQIARSIERFGFTNPVLVDRTNGIIAGHGRVEAAKQLGIGMVADDLSRRPDQGRDSRLYHRRQ